MSVTSRAILCALGVVLQLVAGVRPLLAAERIFFDIDPAQSVIRGTATIEFPGLGFNVNTVGQGRRGIGVPGFSNGTTGQLDGILSAMVDWDAGTMLFGGGALYGLPSGIWEPLPQGERGIAPAFLGVMILDIGGIPTRAVAAIRDFWADYADAYSITNLVPTAPGQYSFVTNEWLATSAQVDLEGQTGLAALIDPGRLELSEKYAAQNSGHTATLSQAGSDRWDIHIPIDTSVFISAGEIEGLGPIYVDLRIQGQLVGRTVELPLDGAPVVGVEGNQSFATAQSLDGLFRNHFDDDIGNELVNTSAVVPHVTVAADWEGAREYYSFLVPESDTTGFFDVDQATFDTVLSLYDATGRLLATNDDAPSPFGAGGSLHSNDAFLKYFFAEPGLYYLAVDRFTLPGFAGPADALASVDRYELQVSLTTAPVPEPASSVLALMGLGVLALFSRRNRLPRGVLVLTVVASLGLLNAPARAASLHIKQSIEDVYDRGGINPMGYRLFLPAGGAPAEPVPLVLFMHGAGERGEDNYSQVTAHIDGLIAATHDGPFKALLLAPQVTDFPSAGGWNPDSRFDRTIDILNQVVTDYAVDTSRIYITGLSMGGFGTFDYLAEYPDLFAAAVPMSGGGSTSSAPLFKDVPIWVFHGALDDVVSVNQSRVMVNALGAAGGSPLYTELPTGGHDIWGPIYNDAQIGRYGLYEWMFAQSKDVAPASLSAVPEPSSFVLGLTAVATLSAWRWRRQRGASRVADVFGPSP